MGLFSKTYKILRTIWPYDEGYGVLITKFGDDDIVYCHGLTKEECEQIVKELKEDD